MTGPATPVAAAPRPNEDGSAAFVSTLRARPETLRVGEPADGERTVTVRVQMPEVWDVLRVQAPASEPVLSLKVRALAALYPEADFHEDYVLKLGGFEVLDENVAVGESGAVDGSTFLLTYRRRRPVR